MYYIEISAQDQKKLLKDIDPAVLSLKQALDIDVAAMASPPPSGRI